MIRPKEEKEERFKQLPAHQLDSSVIIEIIMEQPFKDKCYSYIYNSGRTYRLEISVSALGEITKFILEFQNVAQRIPLFEAFEELVRRFKMEIYLPSAKVHGLAPKIISFDNRLESMDLLNFSCAIDARVEAFVTLDSDFSDVLEKEFGVKIKQLV